MNREIGIIIRVHDAAKAKQEIKNIVDNQVLDQVKKLNTTLKDTGESVEKVGVKSKQASQGLDSFFKTAIKGTGILYSLKRATAFAMTAFESGAGLERAGVQFESSIGKINEVLPMLRNATRGTVEDMKLLRTANRAVMEGLNPKQLAGMYRIATVASRKLGLETEQAIQTVSNAIVRQEESALTTLGTILKTNIGFKVQNALIAKNGGVMSGAMAVAIRQNVIMGELNKKFGNFNNLQEDSVEVLEKFRASMTNLRMSIGSALGTALVPLIKIVTTAANAFSQFLHTVKDNTAFKAFIQYSAAIATFFSLKGIIGGIKLATTVLGKFGLSLKSLGMFSAGFVLFKALGLDFKDLAQAAEKVGLAFNVLFQLLGNYDENTGMSKVLKKDKEALGKFFGVVYTGAQVLLMLRSIAIGTFKGIEIVLKSVSPYLGEFGNALLESITALNNNQPILSSTLQRLENGAVVLGQALGLLAAAFGAKSIANTVKFFGTLVWGIELATAKYWKMAAAWAAANPITAAALGVGAVMYAGNELAEEYGLNKDKEYDFRGYKRPSVQSETPTPRAQNTEFLPKDESLFLALIKETKRGADAGEQAKNIQEQKAISERVNTSINNFTNPSFLQK